MFQTVQRRASSLASAHINDSTLFRSKTVAPIFGTKGHLVGMKIDKAFDVPFSLDSNEARQVSIGVDPMLVLKEYENGFFHLAGDTIVDYRPNSYTGFVHGQSALSELSRRIGFMKNGDRLIPRNRTAEFEHDAFTTKGGKFDVDIGFGWSAFSSSIDSHFEMIRSLCTNEMIFGKGTVMSRSIPMISDWEANMQISNDVLKHMFDTTVAGRLIEMPTERASLADIKLIRTEIEKQQADKLSEDSAKFLKNLYDKLSFVDEIKLPKTLSVNDVKRVPVPVSVYDAMNMATEITTHHSDGKPSSKLKAFAVSCIFDKKRHANLMSEEVFTSTNTFNDPDRAFWAETVH